MQLSRAFTDDDDIPLDSDDAAASTSASASASQLGGNAAPDDASLNAMVTATFGAEDAAGEDEDEDEESAPMEDDPQDEADKAVARAPSVSVLLGKEPEPRPESHTQQVRLEEEQLFNDLEDDLLDEFESSGAGKKVVVGALLLLVAAGVAAVLVPSLNETVRDATGVKVPLLSAQGSATDVIETPEDNAALVAVGTTGGSAAAGAETSGGDETSATTGGTGGGTDGTTAGSDDKPPAEVEQPAPKKKAKKAATSSSKKSKKTPRKRSSSGGSGSLADKGCRYVGSGNLSKGISTLRKAFDRNPRDLDVLTCLGDAYRKKGNTRQARHYYDMALRINKRYRPALRGKEKL